MKRAAVPHDVFLDWRIDLREEQKRLPTSRARKILHRRKILQ